MCGIYAHISPAERPSIPPELEQALRRRGPDHCGSVHVRIPNDVPLHVSLTSTVLALRGDHVTLQPLVDALSGSALCWNGEAWRIGGKAVAGNDGEAVLASLVAASSEEQVRAALRDVEGPFAFVFLDRPRSRVYYGRDRLGRRSLMVHREGPASLSLSSIPGRPVEGWEEVEADGFYEMSLRNEDAANFTERISRHDWAEDRDMVSSIGIFNMTTTKDSASRAPMSRSSPPVQQLRFQLEESLRCRVLNVPIPPEASPSDARVAVLFSGGLDCTVLARLSSNVVPPDQCIDLINVAFENPRIAAQHKGNTEVDLYEICPDRMTARKSFGELLKTCPERKWRLVTVNVPYATTCEHRTEIIRLIYPHNTEMDLSIACALYFAASGQGMGQYDESIEASAYSTTARVLLSGLGADELFGGYGRHGVAFAREGYQGLVEELKLDVTRLGKRNLGRDDRAMAHWGRVVRFPFLDERLVKWAIELPAWKKCDFDEPEGEVEPSKRVLRLLAEELGMENVAREKKRAIQFGARTAKMESGRVKGTTLISAS